MRDQAGEHGTVLVDLERSWDGSGRNRFLFSADGYHPGAKGYASIAALAAPLARGFLKPVSSPATRSLSPRP